MQVEDKSFEIAVIGAGRFGTLWANLLVGITKNSVFDQIHVSVYDSKKDKLTRLDSRCKLINIEEIKNARVIFYCVPISLFESSLQETKEYIHQDAIVCDTCSVKEQPICWMQSHLPSSQSIIGLHPLFGPDSVDNKNHRKVIVSNSTAKSQDYDVLIDLIESMELRAVEMSAEEHDRQSLYSQGLTHLLGRTLNKLDLKAGIVSTKGYESLLEIIDQTCKDSLELFYDLQVYNKNSLQMWERLQSTLETTIEEIKLRLL